jgi:hypothetical protein
MASVFCSLLRRLAEGRFRHCRLHHVAHLQEEGFVVGAQRVVLIHL